VDEVLNQVDPESDPNTYGFYSFLDKKLIPAVDRIIAGEGAWPVLWDTFKSTVDEVLNQVDPESDPNTYGFYSFLQKELIPALEDLATGKWATVWGLFTSIAQKAVETNIDALEKLLGTPPKWEKPQGSPFTQQGELNPDFWGQMLENYRAYLEALRGMMGIPQKGTLQPQSFGMPNIAPVTPALAAAGTATTVNHNETFYIEQVIGANGDFGGARAGAETGINRIRDDLINRRLNG
jgi:hypothetical protein